MGRRARSGPAQRRVHADLDDAAGAAGGEAEVVIAYSHRVAETDVYDAHGYEQDPEAFHDRFAGLTAALLEDPQRSGCCYTQPTDVFQEQNGVHRFDRGLKLDVARVRAAQLRPAAFERPSGEERR